MVLLLSRLRRAEHMVMNISAIIIGVLGALGAIGFRYLIKRSHRVFFQTWEYSLSAAYGMEWWQRLLLPVAGGLLVLGDNRSLERLKRST